MINIVCALDCEARPLIKHFGLQRESRVDFRLYHNSEINLLVTGTGQNNCRSVMEKYILHNNGYSAWLNIGIAGHGVLPVGEGRLVHKIMTEDSTRSWYPPHLSNHKKKIAIDSLSLRTVKSPEPGYPDNCAYDMEAAIFYQTAIKYQTSELVQCYKIISDNSSSSIETISAKKVEGLVREKLPDICAIIDHLLNLVTIPAIKHQNSIGNKLTEKYHFTRYQQIHLEKLVHKLWLLGKDKNIIETMPELKNSSQILDWLENKIRQLPVVLQ